jgi:spermidine/putrescine transport system substrate-binding protein
MELIDWFYKPEIAAMLTEAIEYISPVPSVQDIIKADAAKATKPADKQTLLEVANSPLVWVSDEAYARLKTYVPITAKTAVTFNSIFQPVVAG